MKTLAMSVLVLGLVIQNGDRFRFKFQNGGDLFLAHSDTDSDLDEPCEC